MNKAHSAYQNVNIDTASQGKLILIAYDIAIKHCKMALDGFGVASRIEERTKHLFKAQDAISELMSALRLDVGEIAQNLYQLYDYMLRNLVESNIKDDKTKTTEVIGYLETLRDAWVSAIDTVKKSGAPAAMEQAPQTGFAISG